MRKREEYPYAKDITVGEIRFVYNKPASEVISLMGEPGSADMALSDGTVSVVHVLASPTDSILRQTKDMPTVNRRAIPLLGTEALIWNVNKRLLPDTSPLMGDDYEKAQAEIRHAFALLVDRENAVKNRYGYEPAASIVPPGISDTGGYDFAANAGDSKEYDGYIDTTSGSTERNKAEAVAILRKYYMYDEGIGQFTDVPPLTMLGAQKNQSKDYYTDSFISACASLGIVIAYENQSYADVVARQERGEYEISTTNWFADFADPSSFLSIYTTDNALNLCQFGRGQHQAARIYSIDLSAISENATIAAASWTDTYDVLTDLGATETDKSKRSVLLHQAEDLVMGTWAIMPVWHAGDSYIARKEISGIEATPFNWTFYGHVMQSEEL
jgi:oligopeptide transport system substrate-binding protein